MQTQPATVAHQPAPSAPSEPAPGTTLVDLEPEEDDVPDMPNNSFDETDVAFDGKREEAAAAAAVAEPEAKKRRQRAKRQGCGNKHGRGPR